MSQGVPADGGPTDFDIPNPYVLLRRAGLRPKKGLGQHFLVERAHLARIVEAADIGADDTVLEIGPGLGVLTGALASLAARVVAVEIDGALAEIIEETLGDRPNLEVIVADILERPAADFAGFAPDSVGARMASPEARRVEPDSEGARESSPKSWQVVPEFKIVANLPFYITSAVLRHVLEAPIKPSSAVVMVQREVADRMIAKPGRLSILGVAVQFYARPTRICIVPAGAFVPAPAVDSAVVRLDVHPCPPIPVRDEAVFFRVVRAGFGQKRKQLRNSIAAGLDITPADSASALDSAGIDPRRRAETLALAEWAALTKALEGVGFGLET